MGRIHDYARLVPYYLYSLQEGDQLGTTVVLEPNPVAAAIWWFPQDADLQHNMQQKNMYFWGIYLAKVDWHNMRPLLVLCT
jgi:hypothetical protein